MSHRGPRHAAIIAGNEEYLGAECPRKHLAPGGGSLRSTASRRCLKCEIEDRRNRRERLLLRVDKTSATTYVGAPCKNGHLESCGGSRRYIRIDTCVTCDKASSKKAKAQSPYKARFSTKASAAKRYGVAFNLEFDDVVWPEFCPVLGIKLDYSYGTNKVGASKASPSFDRIDPTKGYIKGNVIIVSSQANSIKQDASPEQILQVGNFYKSLLDKPLP